MNKTFFYLVAAILVFFTSCKKEVEIDKEIAVVKARIGYFEIASVKYKNGELELDESNFPTIIPDDYLEQVVERTGIIISDVQAKTGTVVVSAFNSAGERIGCFCKISIDGRYYLQYAEYIYADRSFTKKGKSTEIGYYPDSRAVFDCSFEKGWNVMYYSPSESKYTTQKPSDKDFIWYYEEFGLLD